MGYADPYGSEKNKKLTLAKFKRTAASIKHLSIEEQKVAFD